MTVFGIDFTSAPCQAKPITCIRALVTAPELHAQALELWTHLSDFEAFLHSTGPWVSAVDFPFGLPRRLIQNLRWPEHWEAYVAQVMQMKKSAFGQLLQDYQTPRAPGDKHHLRQTDALAGARSPMMWFGVPVARMFFEGAPRLLASPANILPCRQNQDSRIILEGYPALLARRWIGSQPYKSDRSGVDSPQRSYRRKLLERLQAEIAQRFYGFHIKVGHRLSQALVGDPSGDALDAMLCAIQAAWAFSRRQQGYGIPPGSDRVEGWIVDPSLSALY
jgi:Protein of unknown function (DUF429)